MQRLQEANLTLAIAKSGRVLYEGSDHGIRSLVDAIERNGTALRGAALADSVVGRAAALLSVYAGIAEVYGTTMSEKAREVLAANSVKLEYSEMVPRITNRRGDDFCPFEKAVLDVHDPAEAFAKLKAFTPY
jgi:hypothetical protein